MAWSNPRSWTVGETLTAANMNTYVSSDLGVVPVASTIGGINSQYYGGSQVTGSSALLRAGSTPYSYLPLIYDATYSHWVSQSEQVIFAAANIVNFSAGVWYVLTVGGYSDNVSLSSGGIMIPYKVYTDAGLTLQVRVTALGKTGSGHTLNLGCQLTPFAVGGAAGTPSTNTSLATCTATTVSAIDSGWVSAPSITANTLAAIIMTGMNSASDAGSSFITSGTLRIRWIG